jgi:hypothetical protein
MARPRLLYPMRGMIPLYRMATDVIWATAVAERGEGYEPILGPERDGSRFYALCFGELLERKQAVHKRQPTTAQVSIRVGEQTKIVCGHPAS